MRCQLEDTVEDESAALEEHITPVPTIVFHDMMGLSFDPEIECDQDKAADPSRQPVLEHFLW